MLVTEGPERVRELVARGAVFDRGADGDIALTREGGHHADRIAHAGGDATGAEISRALVAQIEAVRDDPGIEVHRARAGARRAHRPAGPDGRRPACGVTLHVRGEGPRDGVGAALGRAVVLATGGIGQVFRSSTNPRRRTGDGIAAALRAGAVAGRPRVRAVPPDRAVARRRREGPAAAHLARRCAARARSCSTSTGTGSCRAVHAMAELAPRDVVAHAIVRRMAATGADHVLLDARHLGRGVPARRASRRSTTRLLEHGIDLDRGAGPGGARPALPLGRRRDRPRRAHVACTACTPSGEVACTGVHGANRLASNSLLEGLVFAHPRGPRRRGPGRGRRARARPSPPSVPAASGAGRGRGPRHASSARRPTGPA